MSIVIEATCLAKEYRRRVVLNCVSFRVNKGEIYGFLGPNGAGKTTTIRILLGVTHASAGTSTLLGEADRHKHVVRRMVGATIEHPNFFPNLSAQENLENAARIKRVASSQIESVLQRTGLWERRRDPCGRYSLGMKQRLALASALLGDPQLLILDEPMNGLDPVGMRDIRDMLLRFSAEGGSVFLSSHLLQEVSRLCHRVAVLVDGSIRFEGAPSALEDPISKIEVAAGDKPSLMAALSCHPTARIVEERDHLLVLAHEPGTAGEINEFLVKRGVYVSHLRERPVDLEEAFFNLIHQSEPK